MSITQTRLTQLEYASRSGLLCRGWTDAAIKKFLRVHDKEAPNPYYNNGYPMRLYLLERVEKIEQSLEYKVFYEKNKTRREASTRAIKTKRNNLLKEVAGWEIYIPRQNLEDVTQDAINSYNSRLSDRSDEGFSYEPASTKSNKDFLKRIIVNYLRHRCSCYERKLVEIAGKVGTKEAYILLNQNIFKRISEIFPELQAECDRQLEEKIRQHLEAGNNMHVQIPEGQRGIADFQPIPLS